MAVKALIVDDEEMIRYLVRNMINNLRLDIEVVGEAANGEECLSLVDMQKPQIVITDIIMPRLHGLELLSKLHEASPDIVVIFLSAYKNFEYAQQAVRYGAFDYLIKPIQDEELSRVLKGALSKIDETRRAQEEIIKMRTRLDKYQKSLVVGENNGGKVFKDQLDKAISYVDENFYKDISLREISDRFYFSLTYLSAQFKQRTGQNFNDYLNKLRIEKAKELLMIPEMNISVIGETVGYHDSSYFIKVFKQQTGRTPKDYRRMHKQ